MERAPYQSVVQLGSKLIHHVNSRLPSSSVIYSLRPQQTQLRPKHSLLSSLQQARHLSSVQSEKPTASRAVDDPTTDAAISELVRRLMRLVPHPVAIITSTDTASLQPNQHISHQWRGATVSSFNTVTLNPSPVVSFNIKRQSATFDAIQNSGFFNVHLLNHGAEAQAVAARFASGNALSPFHDAEGKIETFVQLQEARGVKHSDEGPGNGDSVKSPAFKQDAAGNLLTTFRLHCQYVQDKTVDIGNHVVVFGRVAEVEYGPDFAGSNSELCLVYVDQRYGKISS